MAVFVNSLDFYFFYLRKKLRFIFKRPSLFLTAIIKQIDVLSGKNKGLSFARLLSFVVVYAWRVIYH